MRDPFASKPIPCGWICVCIAFLAGEVNGEISFNRDVRPILSDRCFACHGPDAENQDSEFRIDTRDHATTDLGGYAGIVPGDLDASEVHRRIRDQDDPMPPADALKQLTDEERTILDEWIRQGAEFDTHWAFKPLPASVDIPESTWTAPTTALMSPLDRFIARTHRERALVAAAEASRSKWLRRVTFDLTGLPPTIEDLDRFLSDQADGAHDRVVDRLLASEASAERLASEWLDVARYADSYGYQRDDPRYVWPYRDWVIDAFRNNMPYDQFVVWQLAGDLLPDATPQQRLATTFNRLHSHKKEGGVAIEEFRVENVADRIHTVGAAFMGLTLECCRCHDHKYDPLPTKDYYSLGAFFDNIDERGLISFFTDAVPTPAMPLPNQDQQRQIDQARRRLQRAESSYDAFLRRDHRERAKHWLQSLSDHEADPPPGLVTHLDFDELLDVAPDDSLDEMGKNRPPETMASLTNSAGPNAVTPRVNRLVDGRESRAIELTGDDAVVIPGAGHFRRHDAFSTSLWIWTADVDQRGVIYRRSRGWDDAGSVGYELTKENGVLSAKLCHFWPGDAIAVETAQPMDSSSWVHVAVTYDGSSRADGLKIYINGEPAATIVKADCLTRRIDEWRSGYQDLAIGSRYRDRGFTRGRVDEFRLFDRVISAIEVRQLYDGRSLDQLLSTPGDQRTPTQEDDLIDYFLAAVDKESKTQREQLRAARAAANDAMDATPAIMVMREAVQPRQSYVLGRGVYDSRGEAVTPTTPQCLPSMEESLPRDRLGLAQWLVGDDHPLTARVTVNRYWQMMLSRGLVATPEDFGNQGQVPSHPDLLNWLARDFVYHGWNVRRLLKQIALSATYRQTSTVSAEQRERDPENVYLARGTQPRLSAEMIRDNALSVSGLLVDRVGGPPVKPYDVALAYTPLKAGKGEDLYRRSLYTFWKRTSPSPVMMTFNTPTREVCRLKREVTSTPLQALVMLNGNQFIEASRAMAAGLIEKFGNDDDLICQETFRRLTSRKPSAIEQSTLCQLLREQRDTFTQHPDRADEFLSVGSWKCPHDLSKTDLAATTVLINTVMNLDESVRHQ
ncbi:MAG: DUF1553 domain-containing protein [Planctomycetota bacterium]